ncbi:MAG TPA: FliH/SctL family protein [Solirubrobacteraceae bacterium]|nr:FliH/SctL family protein [Solirubrobacteraceae bacterium]
MAVSYAFEPLEPSDPPPRDGPARLLAEAAAEAERIREQARAEGHAEGRAAGHEQGLAEISAATSALGEAVQGVESLRLAVAEAVERDAIELALALAGKVLAGALQVRPELVVEVTQGALRRIGDRRRITVLVNPSDLETVRSAIGAVTGQGSGVEHCDLQSDERVGAGGAIVRTVEGEVDASVQTQLERAREVVTAELLGGGESSEIGQPA